MTGRQLFKRLVFPWLAPLTQWYLRKPRTYRYEGLKLVIPPGVFHPGLFLSTQILIDHLKEKPLSNKRFLELGAGSGLISLHAARRGASVVATDISRKAIDSIAKNARQNRLQLYTLQSDLFEDIPQQQFDLVLINPPYYPKDPQGEADHAWYCGANFEYFDRLFRQLKDRLPLLGEVLMILSEDCACEKIEHMALQHGLSLQKTAKIRKRWEWHFIYQITRPSDAAHS